MQLSVLVVFGLLVVGAMASLDSRILANLPSYQHPNGGFSGANDEVTLEATKEALFLASVYGIRNQLNIAAIPGFIRTCERHDGGYGQTASASKSDVESTRHALLALTYLNQEINVAQVTKFLSSRIDRSTGLASNSEGEATSLRATATLLQSVELLGEGKSTLLEEVSASLLKFLNAHNAGDHFAFDNTPLIAGNYYGVIIGRLVGFDFQDTQVWADFVIQQQSTVGAFYENGPQSAATLAGSADATGTLSILGKIGKQRYGSLINVSSLKTFLTRTADNLHDAAAAHFSMAVVSMDDILRVVVSYEPANPALGVKDSRAVVGAQIKPTLTVKAFNTVSHSGLDVEVTYLLPGEPEKTQRLVSSATNGVYVTDEYVESSKFGSAIFTFTASQFIETVGLMEFEIQDQVSFGYGIEVRPQAIHAPTNKAIPVREPVPLGTDFSFQVSLFTSTETQKTNGDFELIFNVLDASEVLVFSTVEDGRTRDDVPIEFAWKLESGSLPTGFLTFQFNVRGTDGIIHTSDAVQYVYSTTMIATEIEFDGGNNEFSLGSSVTIWMTPALLPDLKTVVALATLDYAQSDITDKRQFVLDATTLAGSEVGSVRGVNHNGRYQFEMPFSHSLDSLGTMVFSFRFVTSSNHAVALSNYDSVAEEVLDDPHAVNATVVADLRATDITEQPTSGSLSYGNEVSLRFRLIDATTEKSVSTGKSSNVYLLLNHHDAQHDASFVSSKHAAVETAEGELAITWHVDPNAIRGAGYLTVVAESADGVQTPISGADGKALRYDVVIDGNIDIDFTATSTDNPFLSHTAIVAQVKLSSNGRPLEGAKLSVDVIPSSSALETFSLPVANGPQGTYSVSWIAAHTKAVSGTYTLKFFREADRIQAAEIDAANEKKYRKERREKELRGQEVGEEEELPKTPITALFEKTLTHTQTLYRPWPIRIEFLVFFVLAYTAYTVWPKSSVNN